MIQFLIDNAETIKIFSVAVATPVSLLLGIATIAVNGYLARRNISTNHREAYRWKERERQEEVQSLRVGLATELELISEALNRRADGLDDLAGEKPDRQVLTPVPQGTPIFDMAANKLHLLSKEEIKAVSSAYVVASTMPDFLLTVGNRLSTDSYVCFTPQMASFRFVQASLRGAAKLASEASETLMQYQAST